MQPSCAHQHRFHAANPAAERGTRLVMWITLAAMAVEIGAGWAFNSYALLADGWHMSSHALAIGLSAAAYAAARRHAADGRFAFGTWKIEILGGFASALFLLGVALLMVVGAVERLLSPQAIGYREAIAVAVLGLVVNVVCAMVLMRSGRTGTSTSGIRMGIRTGTGTGIRTRIRTRTSKRVVAARAIERTTAARTRMRTSTRTTTTTTTTTTPTTSTGTHTTHTTLPSVPASRTPPRRAASPRTRT